jgi:chemotaxis protein MotB
MEKDTAPYTVPPEGDKPDRAAPVKPDPSAFAADWQPTSQPVFVIDDSFYRSRTPPRPVHWSIAWSDLMMTMFILFLTLFANQRLHLDVLAHGKPNTIADETIPVQADEAKSSLVFHPISQEISRKTTSQMKETPLPLREQTGADVLIRHKTALEQPQVLPQPSKLETSENQQAVVPAQHPAEQTKTQEQTKREELNTGIYDLSKVTLANEKLERFASVELVPDKTVRIILTGDLLFPSGQADLTPNAINSLKKLSVLIKKTPYMINVVGHTDSQPVRATRYPSNWELSLARASRVARFLIDDTKMPSTQFSVSGYSSFRPVKPNTNEENRKANRRVEIILSKELPQAEAATPANLQ